MLAEPESTPVNLQVDPPSLARTLISIHGRDVDITETGIDLDFLQALPDEMRADVVEQHMREQRSTQRPAPTEAPQTSSQINPEFLDALPPEIRAEVIMQEALESARRARQAAAPQAAPSTDAPLRFMSGLDRNLREVLLMGATDPAAGRSTNGETALPVSANIPKRHRESLQLLDKSGIAALIRLLFFPEAFRKGYLFKILVHLCENTATRRDLLGLLLSVVQDGSGDLPAVGRSFQQMSLRPAVTPKSASKSKPIDPVSLSPSTLFHHLQFEHVPTFIAQRCFEALSYVVTANSRAVDYFLMEQEQPVNSRTILVKKTKGKERVLPQSDYPLAILLGLLDRQTLLHTPGMMETLSTLLAVVTKPLASLPPQPAVLSADEKALNSTGSVSEDRETISAETSAKPQQTLPADALKFPTIPPPVLKLIVNCLTAGDCSSRTFSAAITTMQHLSCMPEAKDSILQELRTRSQELGHVLQGELRDLRERLCNDKGDIGAETLVKFSPASSSQAQLLRLLKTIDHLYRNKIDADAAGRDLTDSERAVSQIYESLDFDPMWEQLGHSLGEVEARGDVDQIATVLLPLVETLMVVCKYRTAISREVRSPSAPPVTVFAKGDLFVDFTSSHRKVLNAIVRNNPTLLSGSFSLLIRNSRILDFDNKRNWFFQKLKRKRDQVVPSGVLHLNVRRQYVFEDSFHALRQRTGDEIKYGKLSVKFYNEDGVDAGGVTREWYSVLAQQIFDPNFGRYFVRLCIVDLTGLALFEPCVADQQTYQPNKASAV